MATLIKRIISALVLIPAVTVVAVFLPAAVLAAVTALITALALSEYLALSPTSRSRDPFRFTLTILGGAMPVIVFVGGGVAIIPYLLLVSMSVFILHMSVASEDFTDASRRAVFDIAGFVYLPLSLSHFVLMRDIPGGGLWIMLLLVVIWANDTFAYAAGKTFGRRKLCVNLSPGKTVEGAVAGVIGGAAAGALFVVFVPPLGMPASHAAVVSIFIGLISIVGDLAESLFKRGAGVKDSGSIIPGHGGILDRIDSLIFAVPALYYYLSITGLAK